MQRNKLLFVVTLLIASLLFGCKKINDIEVTQVNGITAFNFSELMKDLPDKQSVYLMDLEVMNRQCTQDCQHWILRAESAKQALTQKEIIYGKTPQGLIEKLKAKDLSSGEYSIDGLLLVKEGEQEIKTINFRNIFFVK